MPKESLRPSSMTKVTLQKELRKKGIKYDSSALKADLVALYESRVLKKPAEFSTDDDEPSVKITRSTAESRGNRLSISLQRIDKMEDDISDLTDKQLTAVLKKWGIKFGPIGPTTRKTYERKLRASMAEEKEETPIPALEYSDEEPSEEEQEDEIEVVETPRHLTRSRRQKVVERESKVTPDSATRRRPLHSKTMAEEETIVKEPVAPEPQCEMTKPVAGMPSWIMIIIIAAIVAFLYFVYISMEENPRLLPFRKNVNE